MTNIRRQNLTSKPESAFECLGEEEKKRTKPHFGHLAPSYRLFDSRDSCFNVHFLPDQSSLVLTPAEKPMKKLTGPDSALAIR